MIFKFYRAIFTLALLLNNNKWQLVLIIQIKVHVLFALRFVMSVDYNYKIKPD